MKSQLKKFENYKHNTKILNSILLKELEKKKPHRLPDFKSPSSPRKTSDVISSTIDSDSQLGNSQKNCGIDKCNEKFHKLKNENASLKS